MRKRDRSINIFSMSFLDVLCGALGAITIVLMLLLNRSATSLTKLAEMEQKLAQVELEAQDAATEAAAAKARAEDLERELEAATRRAQEAERRVVELIEQVADLGLQVREKNLVLLIDTSGSMDAESSRNAENEGKLDMVCAGLKLLLATMSERHQVDVVGFPENDQSPYLPLWSELRPVTEAHRDEAFTFINGLEAGGGTPTLETLTFALQNPGYREAGGFILLSDGLPKGDAQQIVERISALNNGRVKIYCIGVRLEPGARNFMESLATRNGGFYVDLK